MDMLIGSKSFSNSKVLFFPLIVCFYIFDVSNNSSLYIVKKIFKIFGKKSYIFCINIKNNSGDFE